MNNQHIIFDCEIVPSHYLACMRSVETRKEKSLWGHKPDDMERLRKLLNNPNFTWVGFNIINFDMPLAAYAAAGASVEELKQMANHIIANKSPAWMTYRDFGIEKPRCEVIDLMNVAPGVMVSLKLYGARMGSPNLQDMPFHHDDWLDEEQAETLAQYCFNDLDETERLFNRLIDDIDLRREVGKQYGIDLLSKSDAQMAEAIIISELGLQRAGLPPIPQHVRYKAPWFIAPQSKMLKDIVAKLEAHRFTIKQSNGAVELPDFLTSPLFIGNGIFQMGIGGLHSQHDICVDHQARDNWVIRDADVGSYYPNILLNAEYVPRGLGQRFIDLYRSIVAKRLKAKADLKTMDKEADSLFSEAQLLIRKLRKKLLKVLVGSGKIQANGTFGKLGSCFSKIYSPDLMLAITVTGQLYLLILIEHLVDMGLEILSANTDGITYAGTPELVERATEFILYYGEQTAFEFEFADYRRLSMKDVNNYVAVKTNGELKVKGLYAGAGLMKNPTNEVCTLAVQAYLATGRPVASFISEHLTLENFPDFLQARTVNGGARIYTTTEFIQDWELVSPRNWVSRSTGKKVPDRVSMPKAFEVGVDPINLGRVPRWYYSTSSEPQHRFGLRYNKGDNLVPKSSNSEVCMALPDAIPADLDIARYIYEANAHLYNMGVKVF